MMNKSNDDYNELYHVRRNSHFYSGMSGTSAGLATYSLLTLNPNFLEAVGAMLAFGLVACFHKHMKFKAKTAMASAFFACALPFASGEVISNAYSDHEQDYMPHYYHSEPLQDYPQEVDDRELIWDNMPG